VQNYCIRFFRSRFRYAVRRHHIGRERLKKEIELLVVFDTD